MTLTPRQRVCAALQGREGDRVPLTIYHWQLPRADVERQLRNEGLCVVERFPVVRVETPNVDWIRHEYSDAGTLMMRETIRTPVGEVYATKRWDPAYNNDWWQMDFFVKKTDDYKVVEYLFKDTVYKPNYDQFLLAQRRWGEDGYVIGNTDRFPFNRLMYEFLGYERFGLDLYDHPELVLSLYELMVRKHREMFRLAVKSPAEVLMYGSNVSEEMIGLGRFERYYLPLIDEFAHLAHDDGKLTACHLDANMHTLLDAVGRSMLDVVEAFTPEPMCNQTVKEAREAWPDKILWINFPSCTHTESPDRIREETVRILREAAPGERFLIGNTEDVPEVAWRTSLRVISETLAQYGVLPIRV